MGPRRPYLPLMAYRLLLTLLALLTGLAAQVGPAESRAVEVASMQVAPSGDTAALRASRAPVALARLPEPGLRSARAHAPQPAPMALSVRAPSPPTVRIGSDRSHR